MYVGALALLVLGLGALVVVGLVVGVVVAVSARPDAMLTSEVATARRHAVVTSGLSLLLLLATPVLLVVVVYAGVVTGFTGGPSVPAVVQVLACAPLIGTLLGLLVLLLGELTWPRPTGVSRTALLQDRSARSLLTGAWPWCAGSCVAVTAALLVLGGVVGDGMTITRVHAGSVADAGPFPGWHLVGSQLVVLGLCVAAAVLAVLAVARRSAVVTADPETDRLLRRASVARVARAVTFGALVTLGPDLLVGGSAAHSVYPSGPWHVVALVAVWTGLACSLAGLAVLAVPVPRLPPVRAYAAPPTWQVPA